MTRVLIVEDHPFQRQTTQDYLALQGVDVTAVGTPEAFRSAVGQQMPDVVLLDVRLPGEDGFALARWLRARDSDVGIIMLTAADELIDRVLGLESGADDYLTKPFEARELLARIRAIARRVTPAKPARDDALAGPNARIPVGTLTLDPGRRSLFKADGVEDRLTEGEFELLQLLLQNPNRPLHRDWLLETTATGSAPEANERAIDLRIMRLRRKIEANPDNPLVIRTVRGVGYVYVPHVTS